MQKQKKSFKPDFHHCAVRAYAIAMTHSKHEDSDHVKKLAYELYEQAGEIKHGS